MPSNRLSLFLLAFGSLLLLVLGCFTETFNPSLMYLRDRLAAGEYWRLITAHLVHLGVVHTLLNLAGLGLVLALFARAWSTLQWLLAFIVGALFTSLCLYYFSPGIYYYAGLSGVLHGLLIFGLWPGLWQRDPLAWLMALAVIAKLGYEQWMPDSHVSTEALIDAPVVTIAHVYGALGGGLTGMVMWSGRKRWRRRLA